MIVFKNAKSQCDCIGLGVGQKHIAAIAVSKGKTSRIIGADITRSEVDYHTNNGLPVLRQELDKILRTVSQWIGKRYVTVRMAIDDPGMYAHTLYFEKFPGKRRAQKQLVAWQMEKALGLGNRSLHVSFCGREGKRQDNYLFVTAMKKDMFDTIMDAFYPVEIVPESIMMSSLYNPYTVSISRTSIAIRIYLHSEYVSLVFLNSYKVPVNIRSFWRRITSDYLEDEIIDSIKDIDRTIHAFCALNREVDIAEVSIYTSNKMEQHYFNEYFSYIDMTEYKDIDCVYDLSGIIQQSTEHPLYFSAVNAALV
jgi:hypothetical protein